MKAQKAVPMLTLYLGTFGAGCTIDNPLTCYRLQPYSK